MVLYKKGTIAKQRILFLMVFLKKESKNNFIVYHAMLKIVRIIQILITKIIQEYTYLILGMIAVYNRNTNIKSFKINIYKSIISVLPLILK